MKINQFFKILLFIIIGYVNGYGQCPTQTALYLESQTEVDNFSINYPGCTVLPNSLIIEDENDTPITNINGLSQLVGINGNLTFNGNPDLISLQGLNNLEYIGEDLTIINFHQFDDLSGLENLESIGGELTISNNGGINNLNGINILTTIGENLTVNGNDALQSLLGLENLQGSLQNLSLSGQSITDISALAGLTNVSENLFLQGCWSLENTEGLNNIEIIGEDLYIDNNPEMTTLNFNSLTSVGNDFEIGQMASLEDFSNMHNLEAVERDFHIISCGISSFQGLNNLITVGRRLDIKSNINLITTTGLDNMVYVEENLYLTSNHNLQNVDGFNSLINIGGKLDIDNNDQLTDLTGFSALQSIEGSLGHGLFVRNNDALENLQGFESLTFIGGILDIQFNQSLQTISGLDNLLQVDGDLEINGDALIDITALSSLTSISGRLDVIASDALESLEGLGNIDHTTITDLNIYSNDNLSYCGVESICNWIDANLGQANINNNITGCNTEAEVQSSCDGTTDPCNHPDFAALIDLYQSTNGSDWIDNSGWADGIEGNNCDPCSWFGITCNGNNRVTEIILRENNLSGSIPSSIGSFDFLRELNLRSNSIGGSIPSSIGSLSLLEELYLYLNQITGTIPNSIGDLTNLTNLSLRDNQLIGNIPVDIINLTNLEDLYLYDNSLSGSIPNNIGQMSSLEDLRLQSNNLSGDIPESIGSLQSLTFLSLRSNNLTGTIPSSIGNLSQLQELWLYSNELTGNLSTFLGELPNLTKLRLENNNLSGCFPTSFLNLCNIEDINTSNNPLLPWQGDITQFCNTSGSISAQLGAPCDDGNNTNGTSDQIIVDCTCGQEETSNCPTEYTIEYPEVICENEQFDFELTFDNNENYDIEIIRQGGPTVASIQNATSPLVIPIEVPPSWGTYVYLVEFYENGNECFDVDRSNQSTEFQFVESIGIQIPVDNDTACEDEAYEITVSIGDANWNSPFEITLIESPTNNVYTKTHTGNSIFSTFNISGRSPGTYTYQANIVNNMGCVGESEIATVEINQKSEINTENTIIEVCQNANESISIDLSSYEASLSSDGISWFADASGNLPISNLTPLIIDQNTVIYCQANNINGCLSDIYPFEIILSGSPSPQIFALGSPDNLVCINDEIDVEVIGDYTSVQWEHGPSSQLITVPAGTYTVTVTTDDCEGVGSITITEGGAQELICNVNGTDINLNAEGAILPIDIYYESQNGNEEILDVNSTNFTLSDFESGNYFITVTDALGCSVTCESVILSNSEIETDIKIYPNPTHDIIHISSNIMYDVRLISITGERVMQVSNTSSIDLSNVITGVYILEIEGRNGTVVSRQKVMKY